MVYKSQLLITLTAGLIVCCSAVVAAETKPNVVDPILEQLRLVNPSAMRRALADLEKMFPDRYPASDQLSARIDELAKQLPAVIEGCKTSPDRAAVKRAEELLKTQDKLSADTGVPGMARLPVRRRQRSPS